jgi:hypothetical protein
MRVPFVEPITIKMQSVASVAVRQWRKSLKKKMFPQRLVASVAEKNFLPT